MIYPALTTCALDAIIIITTILQRGANSPFDDWAKLGKTTLILGETAPNGQGN